MSEVARGNVAVVEDDPLARRLARAWLESAGHTVIEFADGPSALQGIDGQVDAVCLDLGLGDVSGFDVLRHLQARDPDLPVIVTTAADDVSVAVDAMRAGSYDYLVKPLDQERLLSAVNRALERRALTIEVRELRSQVAPEGQSMVGDSAAVRELLARIDRVVDSDVAVSVTGESGSGKELVARSIHAHGRRKSGPFVAINCAAIPDTLLESELFGHEKGAFTGATSVHKGRFEQAHNGTLFLDEVGEMSAATQASLLRTLQERCVRRVGGTRDIPVDVRVVCATHRNLEAEVEAGRFREDLYYRLVVFPIRVPPLRERTEDIPSLVSHFMRKFAADVGRPVSSVSGDALDALSAYRWPGNIRELQNVVHRTMLACDGDRIEVRHLPTKLRSQGLPHVELPATPVANAAAPAAAEPPAGIAAPAATLDSLFQPGKVIPLKELEERSIENAMKAAGGSVTKAARMLGIGRATLYRRLAANDSEG